MAFRSCTSPYFLLLILIALFVLLDTFSHVEALPTRKRAVPQDIASAPASSSSSSSSTNLRQRTRHRAAKEPTKSAPRRKKNAVVRRNPFLIQNLEGGGHDATHSDLVRALGVVSQPVMVERQKKRQETKARKA
ncbi:hypothetical protein BC939DRAFT_498658 [Gamsiella multidivaricata]|uniref:uncharacterized protein n=1 Tax=Gamsiella multidivaricata TaxID=101098 RepID=UPI0022208E9D|nr:uncharacterized protein BC939DRAFT_498658 [Gamsiella multidivaricata]KAI7831687.1 hypothetical protein BC939DRAFT_498658 [Gamsiella multidivaricata]